MSALGLEELASKGTVKVDVQHLAVTYKQEMQRKEESGFGCRGSLLGVA